MKNPAIGLGIDYEIVCQCPVFFQVLTKVWPGRICIFVWQNNAEEAEQYLNKIEIKSDFIIPVNNKEELQKMFTDNGIAYYYSEGNAYIELPLSSTIFTMTTVWENDQSASPPSLDD